MTRTSRAATEDGSGEPSWRSPDQPGNNQKDDNGVLLKLYQWQPKNAGKLHYGWANPNLPAPNPLTKRALIHNGVLIILALKQKILVIRYIPSLPIQVLRSSYCRVDSCIVLLYERKLWLPDFIFHPHWKLTDNLPVYAQKLPDSDSIVCIPTASRHSGWTGLAICCLEETWPTVKSTSWQASHHSLGSYNVMM